MTNEQQKMFLDLYTANQRRLYGYIVTLVSNRNDAEDIFAQTTLVLWEKWHQFDPSRSFISWASGVAYYEVLKFRGKPERRWEGLTEEALEFVSKEREKLQPVLDQRSKLLIHCMDRLKQRQRQLVETCYSHASPVAAIAKQLGKTPNAISSRLRRIRQLLHACIDRGMNREES